jgi:hypothetical protein
MRSFSGLFTCAVAVTLACSSGAACSSERVLPPGVGGAADLGSTVVAQAEAAVGVGVGPSLPPPPIPTAWDVHYGDAADQTVSAAAVDDAGDIALVGTVEGAIDLGNITWPGSTTDTDVVVARIASNGQTQWSRRYGDSCDQHGGAVANLPAGSVLLAGDFCGKMSFGKTAVETMGGEVDLFVAVIDALGEDVYSRSFGGKGAQIARAAAVDVQGNTVVVGSFDQAFDDGSGEAPSAGKDDIFVLALDPGGNVLWSQRFGGPESDLARAVAIDSKGNVLIGGSFRGSLDFGGGPLTAPPGHPSAFVVELDAAGKHLWSQTFSSDDAVINSVAFRNDGPIALTGSFAGSIDLGSGPVATQGGNDAFAATLDDAGKVIWGRVFGTPKSESGSGVAFWANGLLALSITSEGGVDFGTLSGTVSFEEGPHTVYVTTLDLTGLPVHGWSVASDGPIQVAGLGFAGQVEITLVGSFQSTLRTDLAKLPSGGGWDIFAMHRL